MTSAVSETSDNELGLVYAAACDTLVAVYPTTGERAWTATIPNSGVFAAGIITLSMEDGVLVLARRGRMQGFDAGTGELLWSNRVPKFGMRTVMMLGSSSTDSAVVSQVKAQHRRQRNAGH